MDLQFNKELLNLPDQPQPSSNRVKDALSPNSEDQSKRSSARVIVQSSFDKNFEKQLSRFHRYANAKQRMNFIIKDLPKPEPPIPLLQRNLDMQRDLKRRLKAHREVQVESANYEPVKMQQSLFDMKVEPDIATASSHLYNIQISQPHRRETNENQKHVSPKIKFLQSRNLMRRNSKHSSS